MNIIIWKGKERPATPALRVVIAFGGLTKLADALGKRPSTVHRWLESGLIPARHQADTLAAAAKMGIDLDPATFVPLPPQASEAA